MMRKMRKGNLFATGLVAGGALAGVLYAILKVPFEKGLDAISLEHTVSNGLGEMGYQLFGVLCFAARLGHLQVAMSTERIDNRIETRTTQMKRIWALFL